MYLKLVLFMFAALLVLAPMAEARHVSRAQRRTYNENESVSDEAFQSADENHSHRDTEKGVSHKQARVIIPAAAAVKKLVLLKFKKIVPISLILLRSGNESDAELVPVYPTSEIPANVQFIPTPNGISGHKDVQAIAIPNELHEHLEANGMFNLENVETLLNDNPELIDNKESAGQVADTTHNDTPLSYNDSDPNQALEEIVIAKDKKPQENASASSSLRRLAPDDTTYRASLGLKSGHHTTVEEIPLFLYSAKDTPAWHVSGVQHTQNNNRRKHS